MPRFAPRRLQLEVARRALPGGRWQRTVTATVMPPKGVKRAEACEGGRVATVVRRGGATILDREAELDERCRVVVMRLTTRRPTPATCVTRRPCASADPPSWPPPARPGGSADAVLDHHDRPRRGARARHRGAARDRRPGARACRRRPGRLHRRGRLRPGDPDLSERRRQAAGRRPHGEHGARPHPGDRRVLRGRHGRHREQPAGEGDQEALRHVGARRAARVLRGQHAGQHRQPRHRPRRRAVLGRRARRIGVGGRGPRGGAIASRAGVDHLNAARRGARGRRGDRPHALRARGAHGLLERPAR